MARLCYICPHYLRPICSCAWRHCGAHADEQEALAELYNLAGVLEPFECDFCLDIVDRSLRDMLAVIPPAFHPHHRTLPRYTPHQRQNPEVSRLENMKILAVLLMLSK